MRKSVLLGFSGGIDSCTSAERLTRDGYRVVALTIDTIGDEQMMMQAREKAEALGVEWVAYDARKRFERDIIDYFTSEYAAGRTPASCTRCNRLIKWRILLDVANTMGIDYIATGHYINIVERDNRYYVAKGLDPDKDQSYYLWGLDQATLSRALTPMGDAIKSDVKRGYVNKSESMGVCFLAGLPYAEYLAKRNIAMAAGDVTTSDGVVCGQHNGIARYTIGQRRGEGIPAGMRVVGIDADHNRIIVGPNDMLYYHRLKVAEYNIVSREELLTANDITIKIRGIGRNPSLPVQIEMCDAEDALLVITPDAAWAPAVGQPLVFYRNNLVVGGGIVVDFD